jgi:hypothetical protein
MPFISVRLRIYKMVNTQLTSATVEFTTLLESMSYRIFYCKLRGIMYLRLTYWRERRLIFSAGLVSKVTFTSDDRDMLDPKQVSIGSS